MARRLRPRTATFLQTLVYSAGPQLILLKTPGTSLIVAVAVSDGRYDDPFYGAEVSRDQFLDYLAGKFDLRYLMTKPAFKAWYIVDLATLDGEEVSLHRLQLVDELKDKFLPGHGIFAREHTEEVDGFALANQQTQKFDIDGSWDLPEFSQFYGQFTDIYLVFNSVDAFIDQQTSLDERRKIQAAFIKPWEGGGSYNSFYDSLLSAQAREERLKVGAIKYASPGFVDVRGKAAPFEDVRKLVKHFENNRADITDGYNKLHKFLSEMKLLTLPANKFIRNNDVGREVEVRAKEYAKSLAAVPYDTLLKMASGDQLVAAKVLLSIYRRLAKLYEFFLQGRVSFS